MTRPQIGTTVKVEIAHNRIRTATVLWYYKNENTFEVRLDNGRSMTAGIIDLR